MEAVKEGAAEKWKLATHYIQRTLPKDASHVTDPDNKTTIALELERSKEDKVVEVEGSEQLLLMLDDCVGTHLEERKAAGAAPKALFIDGITSKFLSEYAAEKPFVLFGEYDHTILDVKRSPYEASDGTLYEDVSAAIVYGENLKMTVLRVLLPATEENKPYIDRVENMLLYRRGVSIKPKADISRIIVSPKSAMLDLDKLFMALSKGEPMMKAGDVYILDDVMNADDEVMVTYSKTDSVPEKPYQPIMSDESFLLFRIKGYGDSFLFPERSKYEIAKFFREKKGLYFTVGENIYDNMLDYMKIDGSGRYPVFKFEHVRWDDTIDAGRKIKALKAAARIDPLSVGNELGPVSSAWMEKEENSFSGKSIRSMPQLCP